MVKIALFRVTQEALNNVIRHSGAKQAWIRLLFLDQEVCLQVEDNLYTQPGQGARVEVVIPYREAEEAE